MHLSHLGLPVRDERRSQQFYSAYFGFDPATAQEYEDGTVIIRNADGFDLALRPAEHIEPSPAFLHAGFRVAAPADVRALLARMEADGVTGLICGRARPGSHHRGIAPCCRLAGHLSSHASPARTGCGRAAGPERDLAAHQDRMRSGLVVVWCRHGYHAIGRCQVARAGMMGEGGHDAG